jgi:hypothetical protein
VEVLPCERDAKNFPSPQGEGEVRKSDRSADASGAKSLAPFSLPKQAFWAGMNNALRENHKVTYKTSGRSEQVTLRMQAACRVGRALFFNTANGLNGYARAYPFFVALTPTPLPHLEREKRNRARNGSQPDDMPNTISARKGD